MFRHEVVKYILKNIDTTPINLAFGCSKHFVGHNQMSLREHYKKYMTVENHAAMSVITATVGSLHIPEFAKLSYNDMTLVAMYITEQYLGYRDDKFDQYDLQTSEELTNKWYETTGIEVTEINVTKHRPITDIALTICMSWEGEENIKL